MVIARQRLAKAPLNGRGDFSFYEKQPHAKWKPAAAAASRGVGGDPVAAFSLGAIERLVGPLDDLRRLVFGRPHGGDADRDRHLRRARVRLIGNGSAAMRRRNRSATAVAIAMSVSGITTTNSSPP